LERGKVKCARYWPDLDKTETYGNFQVHNVTEDANKDYTLREFIVKQNGSDDCDTKSEGIFSNEERRVYHYHFQVIFTALNFSSQAIGYYFGANWLTDPTP
jgi:hypothetical protein